MSRGLSNLQRRILQVLPECESESERPDKCVGIAKLVDVLYGKCPTHARRVALSKSLNRLDSRGLVELW